MAKSQSNETDRNGRTRTPQGVALYREALVRQVESVQEAGVCPPRPPEILRLRVAGETEKRRAIVLTYISGLANSAFAMAMSLSEVAEGLPPIRPRLRGARNSSIVRSRITPRSNSASAPKLRNMSLSSGVAVSMVPVSERTGEPVKPPHHAGVARAGKFERSLELRPMRLAAGYDLLEHLRAPSSGKSIAL